MKIGVLRRARKNRRVRASAIVVVALMVVGAIAWGVTAADSSRSDRKQIAADKTLQEAVRATRAQMTGEFAIQPIGVEGSFDKETGAFQVDYEYFDPDKDADFVERRIVIDGTVYAEDDYFKGNECWADLTGYSYAGYGEHGSDVALLVDALKGVAGSGHTIEATVPVGLLADAFYGSSLVKKVSHGSDSPTGALVPVTVRIGVDAVQTIVVDMKKVHATLKDQDVSVENAFGEGVDAEFLADQDEVRIVLSKFGFPVTIDRPSPFDIGIDEDDTC